MLFGGIIIILFEVIAWIKELEKGFFRPISLHMITTKKKKPQITKKHFITSFVVFSRPSVAPFFSYLSRKKELLW